MNVLGGGAAWPRALRCQTELRNGAATTAPPTPRRNTLRCMLVLMCWAPRRRSGSCADPRIERVRLGEVGEDVEDGVVARANVGGDRVRDTLILRIRIPAVGEGDPVLRVGGLSGGRRGDPLHELQGGGDVLGRAVAEIDGGGRVDRAPQLIDRLQLTDPVVILEREAEGIDDGGVTPDARGAALGHQRDGGVAVGGVGAWRNRRHGSARRGRGYV